MAVFHYSSYWHTWSRVLQKANGETIEVNLTPIPSCFNSTWEQDVKPIRIRRHYTSMDRSDKLADQLPAEILETMVKQLGQELVTRLLTEDFLPQIDWNKYQQKCNGGANLADIQKDI